MNVDIGGYAGSSRIHCRCQRVIKAIITITIECNIGIEGEACNVFKARTPRSRFDRFNVILTVFQSTNKVFKEAMVKNTLKNHHG